MIPDRDAFPAALVISLDFELGWGVRDRAAAGTYVPNVSGARAVIPRMLEIFEEFQIAATWATVGFLFARSQDELESFTPALRPLYRNAQLSPYGHPVGRNESEDPLHFAPSLVERIQRTPRQEIATHTFSHYYCGEDGQTRDAFRADLLAASAIAKQYGVQLRSIVFPRNQRNPSYDGILCECGFRAYRSNPPSWIWRFTKSEESANRLKRVGRLLDAYIGGSVGRTLAWAEVRQPSGLSDVRASFFLRPYRPALRLAERLRLARIRRSVRYAARHGRIVHLWWHPHNFGLHQEENLQFLGEVLLEFAMCRERYGMRSLSMAEVDDCVQKGRQNPDNAVNSGYHFPSPRPDERV